MMCKGPVKHYNEGKRCTKLAEHRDKTKWRFSALFFGGFSGWSDCLESIAGVGWEVH